ncbi:MAG: PhzF family phenazine biosynthesis protein [Dehalococcoidia bacterium]
MAEYPIFIVDAFTSVPYAGNPAAVVFDADGLLDDQMQSIAREMNLSETAFVQTSAAADFRVRFFTPLKEIPLAGHPTIATMHILVEQGRIALGAGALRVTQELRAGVLPVDLARNGDTVTIVMTQATPAFGDDISVEAMALALGISPADLIPGMPCSVVSTGTPQAMVPVRSIDVLRRVAPDTLAMAELERRHQFFSTHVFAMEAMDHDNSTHARHFASGAGIAEDPVTGSATGGMGAYLWKHGLLRAPRFNAEQGHLMGRPGVVSVEVEGTGNTPTVVRISGTATTVLRGTIRG